MRQPKRNVVHRAATAVYLDATISSVKPCRSGCIRDASHRCVHRFGPDIYVIAHQPRISFVRHSDMQVVLEFLFVILNRWRNGATGVWKRRYVILTDDRRFMQSVEHSFRHERNMRSLLLTFGADGITYRMKGYPWEIVIEVHVLPRPAGCTFDSLANAIHYSLQHFAS